MTRIVVTDRPADFPLKLAGVEVLSAREYLTAAKYSSLKRGKVYNLCRSYSYQSLGYYVSLLAEARGHHPLPSVSTIQDFRLSPLVRGISEELDGLIQRALAPLSGSTFQLSIYFGRNLAKRYDRLSHLLFSHFPAPMMRANFIKDEDGWRLDRLRPIPMGDVPEDHHEFLAAEALRHFTRGAVKPKQTTARYEMAILINEDEVDRPSNERALKRFVRAARKLGIEATFIDKDDYGSIAEYDALFIRETTAVNHHTYRFARRAEAEGLVVIDDPLSIVRCTNKVYLSELFERHAIPSPKTLIVHRDNVADVIPTLGLPCVLKLPDSSFSAGVVKAKDEEELHAALQKFFTKTELVIAQAFTPSEYDYRIGVLNGEALYACRYYMVKGHWQIQKAGKGDHRRYGATDTLPLSEAPQEAVDLALKSTALIGKGLYGVDIKQTTTGFVVIEINDNPSLDADVEDLGQEEVLYERICQVFLERLEKRGRA